MERLPFSNLDEIGELIYEGCDIEGNLKPGQRFVYPFYVCGHCNTTIVLRADRQRERSFCFSCKKLLCEKNELCRLQCTPLNQMAPDHFEGAGKFGQLVPAIMRGATKIEELNGDLY